jgi:uncharacterized SAM-binding protein YcdF (DUF218 family)
MPNSSMDQSRRVCLGLLNKKERWGFSGRGWILLGLIGAIFTWLIVREINPFLAVTQRVDCQYLVMEGWVHQFAANATAAEFRAGKYQRIYITGVPVEGSSGYDSDSDTDAYVGAGLLRRAGISEEFLQRVPRRQIDRDRTYGSALALREWFLEHRLVVHGINVVTEDVHARRTRLLFQEALGPQVKVGIISVPDPEYNAKHWWRYSEGVRAILGETIAYIYARVFFHPPPPIMAIP